MRFKFCAAIFIFVCVVAVSAAKQAQASKKEHAKMNCGICHVIMSNIEHIRVNSKRVTNKGPYSMVTDVLIDETLTHICGVSMESLKSLGYSSDEVFESCNDMIWNHDEAIEELIRSPEPIVVDKACLETVPVCTGIAPEDIPRPSVDVPGPRHPKDMRRPKSEKSDL